MKTELKVGVFAIIVILVLSYMTFKVGGLGITLKKGYRLYVVFDDISGLDIKSRVKIAGVDAGIVEKIALKNGKAELTLLMEPDVKIYEDAEASLKVAGFLGDKNLVLWSGTPAHALLQEGDSIKKTKPALDIDQLANELTSAATYISDLAETIQSIFGESEKKSLKEAIHNLKAITENVNEVVKENREPLRNILARLEKLSNSLGDKGPKVVDDLSRVANDLKEVIEENRYAFKDSMENIKEVSKSASNIAQKIEKGEGTIGKLLKEDNLYDSFNKVAEGAGKTFDTIERMKTFMEFRSEYLTKEGNSKGYFNLTLQPRSDKYYILGLVTDPMGSVEITDTVINGVKTTKEETKRKIKFTAQFAKRFEDYVLRIGMIENTFGLGADYFLANDKAKVSFNAWDFGAEEARAEKAHVKVGFDYRIFKHIFISGGIDNLLNGSRRGIYVGGGLEFEDEDFKYIFGVAPKLTK